MASRAQGGNNDRKVLDRVGRASREELTAQQLRGITALIQHPTIAAAAKQIGVHPRTLSRWLREPTFYAEYRQRLEELQLDLWRQMIGVRQKVWNRFLTLLGSEDERIALKVTVWYIDRLLSVPAIVERLGSSEDRDSVIPPSLHDFLTSDPISLEDTG